MKKDNRNNGNGENDSYSNNNRNNEPYEAEPVEKTSMNPLKAFFIIVGATVGVFVLIAAVAVYGYFAMAPRVSDQVTAGELITLADGTVTSKPVDNSFLDDLFLPQKRTTVLIIGVDKSQTLADVNVVATFDRDTRKIDAISVPRDTQVVFTSSEVAELTKAGRKAPDTVKLTEVHSYAGKDIAPELCRMVVSRLLGVQIDYYIEVNINAFRQIVDTVGGIEMEIPSGGFHYSDPEQDLYINVPGGHQKLTGEMAEGVVRFRTYARGDLQRIEVQHEFMRQFFRQVLNKQAIMSNALGFATTVIKYVKTDFPLTEMPKYIRYIDDLSPDKFTIQTIPGTAENSKYFEMNKMETAAMVEKIFADSPPAEATSLPDASPSASVSPRGSASPSGSASPTGSVSPTGSSARPSASPSSTPDSKKMRLQVLNGARISGIASAYKDKLEDAGYNVAGIGNYEGTLQNYTRIMVKESGLGEDLKAYFKQAVIEIDEDIPTGYDIIIIIGRGEEK